MKNSLYSILVIFFLVLTTTVRADSCSNALEEFRNIAGEIINRRLVSFNDLLTYKEAFEKLQTQVSNAPCAKETLEATKGMHSALKQKRIETLDKYLKLKIYEEGGSDLLQEYAQLTGKKNGKFALDGVFEGSAPKKNNPKAPIQNNKCSDIINQNEAVNLDNARNQDGVGWCYAYTAADLLSFRLKKQISAISLYNSGQSVEDDISGEIPKGGDIGEAIETYLAKKNGLCLESDLPSSDFKFCTYRDYHNFLSSLYQSVKEERLVDSQCLNQNLNSAFPGVDYSIVKDYANRYGSKKLAEFLFDYKCKKKSFINYKVKPVTQGAPYHKVDEMLKKMDGLISKGEVVGVGYNYNLLNETEDGTGGHASLVVGRRQNQETGECEYLIRNSWGKDCTQNEGPGLSCHKNCDEGGGNCRYSGHFWVNQKRLKNSLLGITFLP